MELKGLSNKNSSISPFSKIILDGIERPIQALLALYKAFLLIILDGIESVMERVRNEYADYGYDNP